jgi:hypothetical protein
MLRQPHAMHVMHVMRLRQRARPFVCRRVLQTIVTLDFGESAITLGDDLYGARLTEGGDGSSPKVVLSMLALKKCLGMYKDASCDNAFGFSGIAEPPLVHLPRMSCLLTRTMPKPPPPASPRPPPSPPPGFDIDPGRCPGGGQTYFIVAPHQLASQAALQTWELNIHLNTWYNGMHVIIDFPSLQHADHALHVNAVRPPEVARLISVTKHSAIIELLETAARDFQFEALGDVESLELMCDLSGVRPFPPPPPPSPDDEEEGRSSEDGYGEQSKDRDPGDLTYVPDEESYQSSLEDQGPTPPSPPPLPLPEPMPPTPSPPPLGQGFSPLRVILIGVFLVGAAALAAQQNPAEAAKVAQRLRLLRTKCSRTPLGRKLLALVSQHPIGRKLLLIEARYLGVSSFGPSTDLELVDVLVDDDGPPKALLDKHPRPKPRSKPKAKAQKAAGREDAAKREAEPLQSPNGEAAATEEEIDPMDDWPQVTASSEGTRFVVRLGASASEGVLHLDDAQDLKELMTLVSQACDHLGVDMTRGFRMQLVDEDGTTTTVGKSCTMERVRSAKQIELVPKPSKDGDNPGSQRCRPASGGTVPGPALGGARGRGRPE